jgi:glycosyltransferase involved in cell wall biosynthesis
MKPRMLTALLGDVTNQTSDASAKYGPLFGAMAQLWDLVGTVNVDLRGFPRYWNALRSFRPRRYEWHQQFYKNDWAFAQRTARCAQVVRQRKGEIDLVFQLGAMFAATQPGDSAPYVIYTDFTHKLSQREYPPLDPFPNDTARERWYVRERDTYHRAAAILTRSEHARRSIIDDYGIAPERVTAVGGGVNFAHLPPPQDTDDGHTILCVARDPERKGVPGLIRALAIVRQTLPDARLLLVGPEIADPPPGVIIASRAWDRERVAGYFRSAAVYAMPAICETWGDVFLEAMAYSKPCVGSTNDAMPEIIQEGETGFVVPPNQLELLAARLTQLLQDSDLRRRMGAAGYQRVQAHFTWEQVVRKMAPVVESVIRRSKEASDLVTTFSLAPGADRR